MNQPHFPGRPARLARLAAPVLGLAVIYVAALPRPAWSQSAVWLPQGAISGNIYYNGGNVGIGTTLPLSRLDLNSGNLRLSRYGDNYGYVFQNYGGGSALNIGYMTSSDTTWFGGAPALTVLYTGNVGIGTTTPGVYKLAVEGTIGARDVMVTNVPWSDYVFRPGYRLQPLADVSAFILANHHLPGIPSEAEVKETGVSLGDMQSRLLAKVEELTLHMIQADERNNRLEKQNQELQERIARLEAQPVR